MLNKEQQDVVNRYKLGEFNGDISPSNNYPEIKGYNPNRSSEGGSSLGSDLSKTFLSGTIDVGRANIGLAKDVVGMVSPKLGEALNPYLDEGKASADKLRDSRSEGYKESASKSIVNDDGSFGGFDATTLADRVVGSLPAIMDTGTKAKLMLKGATKLAGKSLGAVAASSIGEGATAGLMAQNDARDTALATDISVYRKSPIFQEALASLDPSLPIDQRESIAKNMLAEKAGKEAGMNTALSTGTIGAITGGGAIGTLLGRGTGKVTGSLIKGMGKGVAEEMFQEMPQSYLEQILANKAIKDNVDPSKDINEGALNALLEGGVVGGVTGGSLGGLHHFSSKDNKAVEPDHSINPETSQPFQNGDVKKAYSNFSSVASSTTPDTESYTNAYTASTSLLKDILSNENTDPIKAQEAKDAIKSIESFHKLAEENHLQNKTSEEVNQKVGEEVLSKAGHLSDSSPESIVKNSSLSPEIENKVTDLKQQGATEQEVKSAIAPEVIKEAESLPPSDEKSATLIEASSQDNPDTNDKTTERRVASKEFRDEFEATLEEHKARKEEQANRISELESKLAAANKELNTDNLTGMPNERALFLEETPPPKAVAYLDLDLLKTVNDTFSHAVGDNLIQTVANVLNKYSPNLVHRLHGDELVVTGNSSTELKEALDKSLEELKSGKHFVSHEKGIFNRPTFSYGISDVNIEPNSPKQVYLTKAVEKADTAMLVQKTARKLSGDAGDARPTLEKPNGHLPGLILHEKPLSPVDSSIKEKLSENNDSSRAAIALDEVTTESPKEVVDKLSAIANKEARPLTEEENNRLADIEESLDNIDDRLDLEDSEKRALKNQLKKEKAALLNIEKSANNKVVTEKNKVTYQNEEEDVEELNLDDDSYHNEVLPESIKVNGKFRTALNSLGNPIHPTLKGIENFWKWFGDSKAVDSNGRPMVYYHGTPESFDTFSKEHFGKSTGSLLGEGFYFTTDTNYANEYASSNIIPAYLKVVNPFKVSDSNLKLSPESQLLIKKKVGPSAWRMHLEESNITSPTISDVASLGSYLSFNEVKRLYSDVLKNEGFDGIDNTIDTLVTFEPNQIKSAIGNNGNFNLNDDNISFSNDFNIKFKDIKVDHITLQKTLKKLTDNLKSTILSKEDLEIVYVHSFEDYDWDSAGIRRSPALYKARGLYNINRKTLGTRVYINGDVVKTPQRLIETFAHEVIGHYGVDKLLGEDYHRMLIKMLNNKDGFKLRKDILSLVTRWPSYLESWKSNPKNDIDSLKEGEYVSFFVNNRIEKIPLEVATKLADEYMAELAKTKFSEMEFLQNQVGLGSKDNAIRSSIRRDRDRWLNIFINRIRHMFKRVFGESLDTLTNTDFESIIAASIDNIFEIVNTEHLTPSNAINKGIYTAPIKPMQVDYLDNMVALDNDPSQLKPEDVVNEYTSLPLDDVNSFVRGIQSGLGNHATTVRSKIWDDLKTKFQENPLLAAMGTFGNMQYQEAYKAIENVFLGHISKVESNTKAISSVLNSISPLSRQAAFYYFTTKGANVNDIPISPIQKNILLKAKTAIRDLGKSLADSGVINKDTYEKNEDMYLHTMYLKYIDQYRGAGKKTSFLSWARSKKDISERESLALGQIKDVRFLVPETIGILARDHILLGMFNTLNSTSIENNLHWVLTSSQKISHLGKKLNIEQAHEMLENDKFILSTWGTVHQEAFFKTDDNAKKLYDRLKRDTESLEKKVSDLERSIIESAHSQAKKSGQWSNDDIKAFLEDKYVKLPNHKQLGDLRNKLVRKEIASDLNALTSAYDLKGKDGLEKFLAPHGTLDRIHRFWKMSMVAYNPASWVRNFFGNFVLLDLSTSTNKFKLISMLHEEMGGLLSEGKEGAEKGSRSEFWMLAQEYGLFGTTFSAIELQDMHNLYADDLKRAQASFESRTNTSLDNHLHFLDERLSSMARMGANKSAKMYSLLEGLFKTVAFRDYVSTWESQNNTSTKDLDETSRKVIYSKAAAHANDSLFDYSQVNSFVKTLRRIPFGSPFITFSYKAIPASVRAMVNHPIKFAQYATLPALLTTIAMAMNDWDDDDINKYKSSLNDYYRNNAGLTFLPFKDREGRPQILSLDYLLPWSQLANAARKVHENFVKDGMESPISTSLHSVGTVFNEFGFLGGPTPSGIAAMLSGKDDFTGRDIITPGASASQQLKESMIFAYNMGAPAWISSNGWFSKMYQAFGKPERNSFGDIKYTPLQAVSDITGFRGVSVNVQSGIKGRKLGFDARLREVDTLRSKIAKDKNLDFAERASQLKDAAIRKKMIRSQMREAFNPE